jgi:Abnormal spindle-like microcephaly-assoc'd, ASPM-SPD-2-Hydin/Beta-propeller repeat
MSTRNRQSRWPILLIGLSLAGSCACVTSTISHDRFGRLSTTVSRSGHAPLVKATLAAKRGPAALEAFNFDPVLVFSTLLGGTSTATITSSYQQAAAMLVDSSGDVYLVGTTNASDFPVTAGVVQASNPSNNYVGFLTKLNSQGQLVFSTYLFGMTTAAAVAIDSSTGDIIVAGETNSYFKTTSLPIPAGTTPFNSSPRSISIVRLNGTATAVLNATYLGSEAQNQDSDLVNGLALDSSGNVYLDGSTNSPNFPVLNPIQPSPTGNDLLAVFVTKLKPDLSALVYSTYLSPNTSIVLSNSGGATASGTNSRGIAVDASGDAYVTGIANPGFPTTSGALQPTCTTSCAFVAKLNPAGSALAYATYLGGNPSGEFLFNVNAIAVDASQDIFVGGGLWGPGFSTLNPVATCTAGSPGTNGNGFVAEISAAGALSFSSCLGQFPTRPNNPSGSDYYDGVRDLTLDSSGKIYVTGIGSVQLPLQNPIQSGVPADADPDSAVFVAIIDPTTSTPTLAFSSLLAPSQTGLPAGRGAIGGSYPNGIGVDSSQNIYVAGETYGNGASGELPIFNALQPAPKEPYSSPYSDAFLLKIAPTDAPAAAVNPGALLFNSQGVGMTSPAQTVTVTNMGSAALSISNVAASGDFSIQNGCSSVAAAGGTCSIQVFFTPTATGNRTGTLTLTDNSAGSPHTISLAGAVGLVDVSFSPSTLSFPPTNVHQNVAESFTFTNTGVLPLVISNVQITGPFSPTGVVCTYLVGGATCSNNQIIFSPTATGPITGALTIIDNALGSPHVLPLSGTSVATLGLGISVSSAPNIDVTAGSSGAVEIDVGGAGIGGSVTLTCSGVPAGATCSISPSTLQISDTSPSRIELSVTTTARSQLPFLSPNAFPCLWTVAVLVGLVLIRIVVAPPSLKARWRLVPLFALVLCACGGNGPSSGDGGGGSSGGGTSAGNYTIVVTAKSGSTTQTLNVPLTVQ